MSKTKVFVLSTQYTNEDETPTIVGVFTTAKLRREAINRDKKRVREEGNEPYNEDYILEDLVLDQASFDK